MTMTTDKQHGPGLHEGVRLEQPTQRDAEIPELAEHVGYAKAIKLATTGRDQ